MPEPICNNLFNFEFEKVNYDLTRVILFRVNWIDDAGNTQVNKGYRIQMNSGSFGLFEATKSIKLLILCDIKLYY